MGTITMNVKRLRCIAGRWFWRPSKSLREQGYKNIPLGSDFVRAIEAAKQLNAQVDRGDPDAPRNARGSVAAIIKRYTEDERFTERAESTRRTYQCALREIEKEFGRTPIVTVQRPHLIAMYRKLKERGKGIARLHMVVWQNLFDMAINEGLRRADDNPARNMRLPKGEKRTRKWTEAEMTAFREAAVAAGRPSVALAIDLAFDLGQRMGDVLHLTWGQWSGSGFVLTQSKTKEALAVPVLSDDLRDQLNRMARDVGHIVLSELTGRPYDTQAFRRAFAKIRKAANLPADLQARDMRRTALSEAGDSGATDDELRSLSGHRSRQSVEHYVPPTDTMAASTQRKRKQYRVAKRWQRPKQNQ